MLSRMTGATVQWLQNEGRLNQLMKVSSGDEILAYVMNVFKNEKSENFYKGLKYVDFPAIFEAICNLRGYYTTPTNLVKEMMKELRNLPSFKPVSDPFGGTVTEEELESEMSAHAAESQEAEEAQQAQAEQEWADAEREQMEEEYPPEEDFSSEDLPF